MAGILLVANRPIASAMAAVCASILGQLPRHVRHFDISEDADPEVVSAHLAEQLHELDEGSGVLVLTDLYGSTPDNIARPFIDRGNVSVVSGMSLPLALKACSSSELPVSTLTEAVLDAAATSVVAHLDS